MSEAPERIWTMPGGRNWYSRPDHGDVDGIEWVRADVFESESQEYVLAQINADLRKRIEEMQQERDDLKARLSAFSGSRIWKCPKCSAYTRNGFICSRCRYDPYTKQEVAEDE